MSLGGWRYLESFIFSVNLKLTVKPALSVKRSTTEWLAE